MTGQVGHNTVVGLAINGHRGGGKGGEGVCWLGDRVAAALVLPLLRVQQLASAG